MISKENLKQKLLNLDYVKDNKDLDDYLDIIIKNLNTLKEKDITQKHHIIPVHCFKHRNLEVDNSKDNLVNLPINDHIKAHKALIKCVKDPKEVYSNTYSLRRMIGGKFENLHDLDLDDLTELEIQDLYKKYNQGNRDVHLGKTHITSQETKDKISNSNKGKYIN